MPNKTKILLAEDDPNLGSILNEYLELKGFEVTLCVDGNEGSNAISSGSFDICLLDVMMPQKDGFTLAKEIRQINEEIPIIFITAKSMKEDKIEGFTIGADDYLTKPFSMEELLLRINAVLRRVKPEAADNKKTKFTIGKYNFDTQLQTLTIEGNTKKLTSKESELLRLLVLNKDGVLERDYALKEIWGNDDYFTARSMDVFITKLRKYLKEDPSIEIMSVHGKGFKFLEKN